MVENQFPKLVICDIDGTLIGPHVDSTKNLEVIRKRNKANNVLFTLASGRGYNQLQPLIEKLDVTIPVIVNNGTGIVSRHKELVWGRYLHTESIITMIEKADSQGMLVLLGGDITEKVYRFNEYAIDWCKRYDRKFDAYPINEKKLTDMRLQRLTIVDPQTPGRIDELLENLGDYLEEVSYTKYDDRSVDLTPKNCRKDQAMKQLSELLEIPLSNVMAIGNEGNDIEMIQTAGIGIAVNNATKELKEVADYVTEQDMGYGVLEALNKFCTKNNK